MMSDITVVIPTIPPRGHLLDRALTSVRAQSLPAEAVAIAVDNDKQGAAITRARALSMVRTRWVAFLDDDDEFGPYHLEHLAQHAIDTNADYVYSWFETVPANGDPFPQWFLTEPWNRDVPRHTTMTVLVKTELAQAVGFTSAEHGDAHGNEDWRFILGCNKLGLISHLCNEKSWYWHHDSNNTSGLPWRW